MNRKQLDNDIHIGLLKQLNALRFEISQKLPVIRYNRKTGEVCTTMDRSTTDEIVLDKSFTIS